MKFIHVKKIFESCILLYYKESCLTKELVKIAYLTTTNIEELSMEYYEHVEKICYETFTDVQLLQGINNQFHIFYSFLLYLHIEWNTGTVNYKTKYIAP